jgi:hypothetical protein
MKILALLSFLFLTTHYLAAQDSLLFRPKEDFEVKLDMQFRPRPANDPNTFKFSDNQGRQTTNAFLPYLRLRVTIFNLTPEEVRYKVQNNFEKKGVSRKISKTPILEIDAGFTDDIKAKLRPSQYLITLMTVSKKETSKILIQIEKDGTFFVNGEKRGKF